MSDDAAFDAPVPTAPPIPLAGAGTSTPQPRAAITISDDESDSADELEPRPRVLTTRRQSGLPSLPGTPLRSTADQREEQRESSRLSGPLFDEDIEISDPDYGRDTDPRPLYDAKATTTTPKIKVEGGSKATVTNATSTVVPLFTPVRDTRLANNVIFASRRTALWSERLAAAFAPSASRMPLSEQKSLRLPKQLEQPADVPFDEPRWLASSLLALEYASPYMVDAKTRYEQSDPYRFSDTFEFSTGRGVANKRLQTADDGDLTDNVDEAARFQHSFAFTAGRYDAALPVDALRERMLVATQETSLALQQRIAEVTRREDADKLGASLNSALRKIGHGVPAMFVDLSQSSLATPKSYLQLRDRAKMEALREVAETSLEQARANVNQGIKVASLDAKQERRSEIKLYSKDEDVALRSRIERAETMVAIEEALNETTTDLKTKNIIRTRCESNSVGPFVIAGTILEYDMLEPYLSIQASRSAPTAVPAKLAAIHDFDEIDWQRLRKLLAARIVFGDATDPSQLPLEDVEFIWPEALRKAESKLAAFVEQSSDDDSDDADAGVARRKMRELELNNFRDRKKARKQKTVKPIVVDPETIATDFDEKKRKRNGEQTSEGGDDEEESSEEVTRDAPDDAEVVEPAGSDAGSEGEDDAEQLKLFTRTIRESGYRRSGLDARQSVDTNFYGLVNVDVHKWPTLAVPLGWDAIDELQKISRAVHDRGESAWREQEVWKSIVEVALYAKCVPRINDDVVFPFEARVSLVETLQLVSNRMAREHSFYRESADYFTEQREKALLEIKVELDELKANRDKALLDARIAADERGEDVAATRLPDEEQAAFDARAKQLRDERDEISDPAFVPVDCLPAIVAVHVSSVEHMRHVEQIANAVAVDDLFDETKRVGLALAYATAEQQPALSIDALGNRDDSAARDFLRSEPLLPGKEHRPDALQYPLQPLLNKAGLEAAFNVLEDDLLRQQSAIALATEIAAALGAQKELADQKLNASNAGTIIAKLIEVAQGNAETNRNLAEIDAKIAPVLFRKLGHTTPIRRVFLATASLAGHVARTAAVDCMDLCFNSVGKFSLLELIDRCTDKQTLDKLRADRAVNELGSERLYANAALNDIQEHFAFNQLAFDEQAVVPANFRLTGRDLAPIAVYTLSGKDLIVNDETTLALIKSDRMLGAGSLRVASVAVTPQDYLEALTAYETQLTTIDESLLAVSRRLAQSQMRQSKLLDRPDTASLKSLLAAVTGEVVGFETELLDLSQRREAIVQRLTKLRQQRVAKAEEAKLDRQTVPFYFLVPPFTVAKILSAVGEREEANPQLRNVCNAFVEEFLAVDDASAELRGRYASMGVYQTFRERVKKFDVDLQVAGIDVQQAIFDDDLDGDGVADRDMASLEFAAVDALARSPPTVLVLRERSTRPDLFTTQPLSCLAALERATNDRRRGIRAKLMQIWYRISAELCWERLGFLDAPFNSSYSVALPNPALAQTAFDNFQLLHTALIAELRRRRKTAAKGVDEGDSDEEDDTRADEPNVDAERKEDLNAESSSDDESSSGDDDSSGDEAPQAQPAITPAVIDATETTENKSAVRQLSTLRDFIEQEVALSHAAKTLFFDTFIVGSSRANFVDRVNSALVDLYLAMQDGRSIAAAMLLACDKERYTQGQRPFAIDPRAQQVVTRFWRDFAEPLAVKERELLLATEFDKVAGSYAAPETAKQASDDADDDEEGPTFGSIVADAYYKTVAVGAKNAAKRRAALKREKTVEEIENELIGANVERAAENTARRVGVDESLREKLVADLGINVAEDRRNDAELFKAKAEARAADAAEKLAMSTLANLAAAGKSTAKAETTSKQAQLRLKKAREALDERTARATKLAAERKDIERRVRLTYKTDKDRLRDHKSLADIMSKALADKEADNRLDLMLLSETPEDTIARVRPWWRALFFVDERTQQSQTLDAELKTVNATIKEKTEFVKTAIEQAKVATGGAPQVNIDSTAFKALTPLEQLRIRAQDKAKPVPQAVAIAQLELAKLKVEAKRLASLRSYLDTPEENRARDDEIDNDTKREAAEASAKAGFTADLERYKVDAAVDDLFAEKVMALGDARINNSISRAIAEHFDAQQKRKSKKAKVDGDDEEQDEKKTPLPPTVYYDAPVANHKATTIKGAIKANLLVAGTRTSPAIDAILARFKTLQEKAEYVAKAREIMQMRNPEILKQGAPDEPTANKQAKMPLSSSNTTLAVLNEHREQIITQTLTQFFTMRDRAIGVVKGTNPNRMSNAQFAEAAIKTARTALSALLIASNKAVTVLSIAVDIIINTEYEKWQHAMRLRRVLDDLGTIPLSAGKGQIVQVPTAIVTLLAPAAIERAKLELQMELEADTLKFVTPIRQPYAIAHMEDAPLALRINEVVFRMAVYNEAPFFGEASASIATPYKQYTETRVPPIDQATLSAVGRIRYFGARQSTLDAFGTTNSRIAFGNGLHKTCASSTVLFAATACLQLMQIYASIQRQDLAVPASNYESLAATWRTTQQSSDGIALTRAVAQVPDARRRLWFHLLMLFATSEEKLPDDILAATSLQSTKLSFPVWEWMRPVDIRLLAIVVLGFDYAPRLKKISTRTGEPLQWVPSFAYDRGHSTKFLLAKALYTSIVGIQFRSRETPKKMARDESSNNLDALYAIQYDPDQVIIAGESLKTTRVTTFVEQGKRLKQANVLVQVGESSVNAAVDDEICAEWYAKTPSQDKRTDDATLFGSTKIGARINSLASGDARRACKRAVDVALIRKNVKAQTIQRESISTTLVDQPWLLVPTCVVLGAMVRGVGFRPPTPFDDRESAYHWNARHTMTAIERVLLLNNDAGHLLRDDSTVSGEEILSLDESTLVTVPTNEPSAIVARSEQATSDDMLLDVAPFEDPFGGAAEKKSTSSSRSIGNAVPTTEVGPWRVQLETKIRDLFDLPLPCKLRGTTHLLMALASDDPFLALPRNVKLLEYTTRVLFIDDDPDLLWPKFKELFESVRQLFAQQQVIRPQFVETIVRQELSQYTGSGMELALMMVRAEVERRAYWEINPDGTLAQTGRKSMAVELARAENGPYQSWTVLVLSAIGSLGGANALLKWFVANRPAENAGRLALANTYLSKSKVPALAVEQIVPLHDAIDFIMSDKKKPQTMNKAEQNLPLLIALMAPIRQKPIVRIHTTERKAIGTNERLTYVSLIPVIDAKPTAASLGYYPHTYASAFSSTEARNQAGLILFGDKDAVLVVHEHEFASATQTAETRASKKRVASNYTTLARVEIIGETPNNYTVAQALAAAVKKGLLGMPMPGYSIPVLAVI